MQAPSTPPGRASRQRTPPSPTHGAYEEPQTLRRSRRNTGPLASPPASPAASPRQPMLHSGAARKRRDNAPADLAMLLTPSKTPVMPPPTKRQRASSVQESARVLSFQPENPNDVMPTPRDTRRNKVQLTGDDSDFRTDINRSSSNHVQVYTDTRARVPDNIDINDFFMDVPRGRLTTVSEPSRVNHWRESPSPPPKHKSAAQRREEARLQAAVDRGEGVFMMFRGKKVYRTFAENGVEDVAALSRQQQQLKNAAGGAALRPITRSTIRPRQLWTRREEGQDPVPNDLPVARSLSDEEATTEPDDGAESDVGMSNTDETAPISQEHDSRVAFTEPFATAAPAVRNTPGKPKSILKSLISPPTTARTPRQTKFSKIPSFEEVLEADDEAQNLAALPTPQRSSRKKKASLKDIPIYEDAPEQATPARTRNQSAASNLTPIVEDDDEPTSSGAASSSSATAGRRNKASPFDSWQRTKSGTKRDSDAMTGDIKDAPAKRSRSGARSNTESV